MLQELKELFNRESYTPGHWQGHRKLTKGKKSKRITMFASRKNGFSMPCESSLEKNYCYHLEFDDAIKEYRTQGIQFEIEDFKYTPDFILLTRLTTFEIVEIKPGSELENPEVSLRLSKVKDYFSSVGMPFSIVTDEVTEQQPELDNYKYVYRAAQLPFKPSLQERALNLIRKLDSLTVIEIRQVLELGGLPPSLLEFLIVNGKLNIDYSLPNTMTSGVYLSHD
ncbi:MAG: TnsA endonuclease N-terminal domain-containing protein [Kangiella sp.]|nr:TnsA endonuclease N-terminal domain-containing protein [Kangiella sp.]